MSNGTPIDWRKAVQFCRETFHACDAREDWFRLAAALGDPSADNETGGESERLACFLALCANSDGYKSDAENVRKFHAEAHNSRHSIGTFLYLLQRARGVEAVKSIYMDRDSLPPLNPAALGKMPRQRPAPPPPSVGYITPGADGFPDLAQTLAAFPASPLCRRLKNLMIGTQYFARIEETAAALGVGYDAARGRVGFWYQDNAGNIGEYKAIKYKADGHRDKETQIYCRRPAAQFFGQHLNKPGATVAIVEGEKTALYCSIVWPGFLWLACGGKQFLRGLQDAEILRGRDVLIFPDADAAQEWAPIVEAHGWRLGSVPCWRPGGKEDIADALENVLQQQQQRPEFRAFRQMLAAGDLENLAGLAQDLDLCVLSVQTEPAAAPVEAPDGGPLG